MIVFAVLLISAIFDSYGQLRVPFAPRTAVASPLKTVYNIKGDFTMVGNTNLTLVNYSNTGDNANAMRYVDIDGDSNTWNSSSATLAFSTENGAIPECSQIIYAGLYWTGRASDNSTNPHVFNITRNGVTKSFDKRKVMLKGPGGSYVQIISNTTTDVNKNIYFPDGSTDLGMYSSYADVTDYVQTHGLGEYFVADIALREGSTASGIGLYGGWGMVVVYENSKMKYRDITVFDGHAFVTTSVTANYEFDIVGFNAVQSGNINIKLGLMAGEGDERYTGDYFQIQRQDNGLYQSLSHSTTTTGNFFNSSINTGGNARNPNLQNNTGLDIAMFNIPNPSNAIITNNQTSTRFRYGSTVDTYCIFNVTFSVDAYIPDTEGVLSTTSINGDPNASTQSLEPGQTAGYKIEIRNKGTEATNNTIINVPIPNNVNTSNLNITSNVYAPLTTTNVPVINPPNTTYPNGYITWNLGTLPVPINPDTVLADISFSLTVTTDCTTLLDPSFDPNIALYGSIKGTGAISNINFDKALILGYQTTGLCTGEPIPIPSLVAINYINYTNAPPTASNPAPINVQCKADVPDPDILVVTDEADNSGIDPIVAFVSDVSDNGVNPEIITRTYSVTDDCGNTINVEQTITINDNIKPIITGSIPATTVEGCSATDATPAVTSVAALEALGLSISDCTPDENLVVTSSDTSLGTCPIVITRTYTITDASNNFETVTQTINISDTSKPVITGSLPTTSVQGCSVTDVTPAVTTVADLEALGLTISDCTSDANLVVTSSDTSSGTCPIVVTRTYTITDACNNFENVTQTININDTTPPSLTGTIPAGATNQNICFSAIPVGPTIADIAAQFTDNCGGTITVVKSGTPTGDDCAWSVTYAYTIADECGNTIATPVQITYTGGDITAPVLTIPADETVECDAIPAVGIPTATDNCDADVTITYDGETRTNGACEDNYTLLRTWTATDNCGNETTLSQTIIVQDTTAPILTIPADITVECDAIPAVGIPTATDNCDVDVTITYDGETRTNGACEDNYTLLRTWTATDNCGNETTLSQTIIVQDTTAPILTIPADIAVECDAIPAVGSPTATDNCDVDVTITYDGETRTNGTCEYNYTLLRTWTATDNCGNDTTLFQTISVQDTTAPTITCPANIITTADPGQPNASVTIALPVVSDNCDSTVSFTNSYTGTENASGTYNLGTTTVTYTASDNCGNITECSFTVTVNDQEAPEINCPPAATASCIDLVPNAFQNYNEFVAAGGTATDNSGINEASFALVSETSNNNSCPETISRVYTISDNDGNFSECTHTIIVNDDINPVLTVPSDVTVECDAIPVVGTPTATDNCDADVTITYDGEIRTNGTCEDTYTLTRTWTATDNCGNETTLSQTINVQDTTAPVLTVPVDFTVECDAIPAVATPTATDNCDADVTIIYDGEIRTNGTCEHTYTLTRTWTATDNCGNDTTLSQIINVQDTTAPVLTVPADVTVECDAIPAVGTPTATDNCDTVVTITYDGETRTNGTCDNTYSLTRTWTATDNCGNDTTLSQTINVQDTTAPVLTVPADVIVECSEDFSPVATGSATAIDNCDATPLITFSDVTAPGSCPSESIITRTWIATDNCNNSTSNIQTITIKDTTAPNITVAATNIVVQCDGSGNTSAINDWLNNNGGAVASDNCGTVTWSNSYNGTESDCATPIDVVFTAIDECGNISSTIASYSIVDTIAPTIDTPAANVTVECDGTGNISDLANWLSTFGGATASDDCSTITWTNDFTTLSDDCGATGSTTVTFTATDGCGNSSTTVATFTIIDTTAPTAPNAPADITYECIDDVPAAANLIASDNCSGEISVTATDTTDNTDPCNIIITRTWTFTDACNNTSSVSQTITVKDTTAPLLTLPANVSAECSDDLTPIAFGSATATDNCDANPVITYNDVRTDGDCSGTFTITRTWTATDACGNVSTADQIISTSDTTAPEFVETTLPQDITIECNAIPAAETLTANDNCGTATVTVNDIRTNGSCANNYIITRTWTATDECGLTKTHIQKITVQDTTPPTFVETLPPTNLVVECDAVPTAQILTATDICGSATVTVNDVRTNGNCPNNYTLARTWTATDECGLKTSHTQIIVVRDTKAPKFVETLPSNITVECDAVPNALTLTATDNCGSAIVTVNDAITIGNCPSNYIIARTYTATDECGLKTTHTQLITVQDTKAPTAITTFDAVLNVSCTNIPEVPDLKFKDNCSSNIKVVYSETNTFADNVYLDYEIVRTWTVTDECDNEAIFTQTLNVALDEIISSIVAQDRCFDDGIVNLNDLISSDLNKNGTWELLEGDPTATLTGSIFNPTVLQLSRDFLPEDGGIDYKFRYTTTDNGCISITEMTMNIHADCVVLPCGENDVVISKAVTPNGDAYNEFFEISGIELCGFRYDVKIFNRWGALIYESDNYQNNWNGTVSKSSIGAASKIPNGTYYYIVTLKDSGLPPFTGPLYIGTK